ncbi:MAG: SLC13 family permease [Chloroflexi bacterium]|nr:MAG: SLC13 family permease [Chloroflexota bacterium]
MGRASARHYVPQVSTEQALFMAILVVAIGLLITERLRPDLVAVLIILALAYSRLLSTDDALSGLKSEPAVVIASMFVLSAGLQTTGLSEFAGRWIGVLAGTNVARMLAVLMPTVALASAFTHHVTITAVMLPITLSMAHERQMPASRLLMPMAIASSLGTTITILGAPSFLVSSELLRQAGRAGLGVFSIAPIGIVLTLVGTIYMVLFGRFLVPSRRGLQQAAEHLQLDSYLTELRVVHDSPLIGRTIDQVHADDTFELTAVGLLRGGQRLTSRLGPRALREGDVLLIRTTANGLATIRQEPGWELEPVERYADDLPETHEATTPGARDEEAELDKVLQAIVAPRSSLEGRTIADVDFRRRYRVLVLGIWRKTQLLNEELSRVHLAEGDVLVLQGSAEAFARLASDRNFLLLTPFEAQVHRPQKALIAGLVMLGTVVGATLNQIGLGLAAVSGATAMVLTRCLTARGAIPLGAAMKKTGTADLVARWLQGLVGGWSETLVLLAIFATVGVIVQFMGSDSATVALFGPVAIALAQALGQPPEAYVIAVAIAAVTAILTPMSHHNLIIYAPGGYRFFDYTRVGAPLTLLLGIATALLAPRIWPNG